MQKQKFEIKHTSILCFTMKNATQRRANETELQNEQQPQGFISISSMNQYKEFS